MLVCQYANCVMAGAAQARGRNHFNVTTRADVADSATGTPANAELFAHVCPIFLVFPGRDVVAFPRVQAPSAHPRIIMTLAESPIYYRLTAPELVTDLSFHTYMVTSTVVMSIA